MGNFNVNVNIDDLDGTKHVIVDAINSLIKDNEYVSEIETNGPGLLFYKERGVRKSMPLPLKTQEQYNEAIDGLIEKAGLIKRNYLVEGRYTLPGGKFGRLHIAMPPAAPYPLVTLAIKTQTLNDLTSIQSSGSFNTEISLFLRAAIASKLTIVISGGTGSGKTTLLEALTTEIDINERVGVCEDTPELELQGPNTPYLNSVVRVPGMDDKDVADLSWTVQQINRMRVDRIIIGETRGKEFFDFVIAANSGKPGSLTTIHANSGPAAMKKMSTFMYMAVDMSPRIISEMIAEAVDVVIQLGHNEKTGAHKIISIHEVTNAISSGDSPTIALNPLFIYDHDSDMWEKRYATDNLKSKLKKYGYDPNTYTIAKKENEFEHHDGGLPSYFKKGD